MGYRSDVEIVIYGEEEHMVALIAAQRIKGAKWLKDDDCYEINKYHITPFNKPDIKTSMVMIHASFQGVKWYDGYEDVDCWHELLRDAQAEHLSDRLSTEFVRVGEESGDIVEEYEGIDPEPYLYAVQSIDNTLPVFEEEQTNDNVD